MTTILFYDDFPENHLILEKSYLNKSGCGKPAGCLQHQDLHQHLHQRDLTASQKKVPYLYLRMGLEQRPSVSENLHENRRLHYQLRSKVL